MMWASDEIKQVKIILLPTSKNGSEHTTIFGIDEANREKFYDVLKQYIKIIEEHESVVTIVEVSNSDTSEIISDIHLKIRGNQNKLLNELQNYLNKFNKVSKWIKGN